MANLTIDQKYDLVNKYKPHFDAYVSFGTADLNFGYQIFLEFGHDENCYTDHKIIHMGLAGIDAETEDELIMSVDYIIGHEIQHIRSTPDKMWMWGQKRGTEVILEKASKILEKKPRRFHKDLDYELFFKWLAENDYALNKNVLDQLVHRIKNSLEDGRIERIRSVMRKGFKEKMTAYRAKSWENSPVLEIPLEKMDDSYKLTVILNQVLTLSTMSIYQKGFKSYYGGTELEERCKKLMPYIAKAVNGRTCEDCMKNAICIMEELTDLIISTAKMKKMDDVLKKLIQIILNGNNISVYGNNGRGEESTSKSGENPFGVTDITIEMTQEEWEKTKKQFGEDEENEGNEGNEGGLRINVIITDKEESEDKDNKGKEKESSGSKSEKAESSKDNNNPGSSKDVTGNEQSDSFSGDNFNNEQSEGNSGSPSQAAANAKDINKDEVKAAVEKAMQDAVTKQQADVNLVKEAAKEKKHASPSLSNQPGHDIKPNPKAENITKLYGDRIYFEEFKRNYSCNIPLPFDLAGKSKVFSKKIDEVIQKQFRPAVRCKKSGKIDGGMVYKLGMNRTDIFMTPARSDKVSGCCYILGDNSGSMGSSRGSKRDYCWRAVAEIEEGYSKLMPLKICAFDCGSGVFHEVVKDWNEKLPNSGAYNFMLQGRPGGSNMDGYSISVATDEILRQTGKIKLLIVLSDGEPDSYENTAQAIKYARENGVIVIGIYFCNVGRNPTQREKKNFEYMYGTDGHAIVTTPENISTELYNVMKKTFLS